MTTVFVSPAFWAPTDSPMSLSALSYSAWEMTPFSLRMRSVESSIGEACEAGAATVAGGGVAGRRGDPVGRRGRRGRHRRSRGGRGRGRGRRHRGRGGDGAAAGGRAAVCAEALDATRRSGRAQRIEERFITGGSFRGATFLALRDEPMAAP